MISQLEQGKKTAHQGNDFIYDAIETLSVIHWVESSQNRKQNHSAQKTVINIKLMNSPNYFRISQFFLH